MEKLFFRILHLLHQMKHSDVNGEPSPVSFLRLAFLLTLIAGLNCIPLKSWSQLDNKWIDSNQMIYFEEIGGDESAVSLAVNAMLQDNEGYVWIGSENGLKSFDGHQFETFRSNQNKEGLGLGNDNIKSLFIFKDSILCIGTADGLSLMNLRSRVVKHYLLAKKAREVVSVNVICSFSDSLILLGTDRGLMYFNPVDFSSSKVEIDPPLCSKIDKSFFNKVYSICHHPFYKDRTLLGTNGGVIEYDIYKRSIVKAYPLVHHAGFDFFMASKIIVLGTDLWCGGWGMGLNKLDLRTGKWSSFLQETDTKSGFRYDIYAIYPKNSHQLWLATGENGLLLWDSKLNHFSSAQIRTANPDFGYSVGFSCLFLDRDSLMWAGGSEGLFKQNKKFRSFKRLMIPVDYKWLLLSYFDCKTKDYYFGFSHSLGLAWLNNSTGKWSLLKPLGVYDKSFFLITKLLRDSNGVLWATSSTNGLYVVDTTNRCLQPFSIAAGNKNVLNHMRIYSICEDNDHNLWMGTLDGQIILLDSSRRKIQIFTDKSLYFNNLPENSSIRAIEVDRFGHICLGHSNGLTLIKVVNNHYEAFNPLSEKARRGNYLNVYSLILDTLNNLWVGTRGRGLLKVSENRKGDWLINQVAPGLFANSLDCRSIVRDVNGCFWFNLDGLAYLNPYTETYQYFNEYNGLIHRQRGDVPVLADSNGDIFFGNEIASLVNVNHKKESNLPFINLLLNKLIINGENRFFVNDLKSMPLKSNENNIIIGFSAICFVEHQQIQYRYKLEPLDQDWVYTGTWNEARFLHLPAGSYRFVLDVSYKGKWLSQTRFFDFEIAKVFWKRPWFIVLLVLIALFSVFVIYEIKIRSIIRIQRIRSSIASDLHDEVSSTLSSISIKTDILAKKNAANEVGARLVEIGKEVIFVADKMDDIIWLVNPLNDGMDTLFLRIREYAIPLMESKGIILHFEASTEVTTLSLKPDHRKMIYLIIKEAVNNLVKYSLCSKAQIIFELTDGWLTFLIKDDGIGFDVRTESSRNGIRNMKKRAELNNAIFEIDARPTFGVCIKVKVKIR